MSRERVLLFAKAPEPGRVKTRLIPALGAEGAAELQRALVADVARRLAGEGREVLLYHHPERPGPFLEGLGLELRPQRGGDLGERLHSALAEQARDGVERTVIFGTDSPDLPRGVAAAAFAALDAATLVLGPSVDGGYYLLGARGVPAGVLEGVPWGSGEVLAATLAAVRRHAIPARLLDVWYDVDRPPDLAFLETHLEWLEATVGEDRCPATRAFLAARRRP